MCKLLLMTGITEGKVAEEFMRRIAIPMSIHNRDGIGYTGVDAEGNLFSQRWHNNEQFMDKGNVMTPEIAEQLAPYTSRLPKGSLSLNYSEQGNIDFDNVKTVTMHTRFATCGREFANTHPFIDQDVSLVHNGTIRNADVLKVNKISTCDSEAALQTYLDKGVAHVTSAAKSWLDILTGSWAFGILARNTEGKRILDVVRGLSTLYYMEIEGLGKVFATSDDDAVLVAKSMNLNITTKPYLVSWDTMYRFDALSGELMEDISIRKTYVNPHYNTNPSYGNTGAKHTRTTGTSNSSSAKASQYNLAIMKSAMGDDSMDDMMDGMEPDVFTAKSTFDNPIYDTTKVARYCNNIMEPFLDRLDIFDQAYSTEFLEWFEELPSDLQVYVEDCDMMQGFRTARQLIKQLVTEKSKVV